MTARRSPRRLGAALGRAQERAQPATLLAAVQGAWPGAVGEAVAVQAQPVAERDGVVTVACRSATWAQELDLLQSELISSLRKSLAAGPDGRDLPPFAGLRFTADAARHFST